MYGPLLFLCPSMRLKNKFTLLAAEMLYLQC